MRMPFDATSIDSLTKAGLQTLIGDVKRRFPDATSQATIFMASERFGLWHNRARAKLCRYYKNHPPAASECVTKIDAIINHLIDGDCSTLHNVSCLGTR